MSVRNSHLKGKAHETTFIITVNTLLLYKQLDHIKAAKGAAATLMQSPALLMGICIICF